MGGTVLCLADSNNFYYALDHADNCTGIVDIIMEQDGWFDSNRGKTLTLWNTDTASYDSYVRRGENSYVGHNDDRNYVRLLYYNEKDFPDSIRITAIGLSKLNSIDKGVYIDPTMIIGSTGGSELKPGATDSEVKEWSDWWKQGYVNKTGHVWHDEKHKKTQFIAVYSVKPLRITHLNDKTVTHPKVWGW